MRRRQFIALLGGSAVAWPLAPHAQQRERVRHIGVLLFAQQDWAVIRPCLQELQALGYVDGKTIAIEYRDAEGKYERLPELAAELVRLNPDVIFSFGGEQAPIVKAATASIPIVVVVSNDPVASGLVASLARPGGNVTGVTYVHDQLAGKTVELLKDAVPWVVAGARILALHRQRIGDFAAKNRLILVGTPKWLSEVGSLLTYGPNATELNRRAASYIDKILKGAKPADLPMQQPATYELVINLKTAKTFGLTIPPTLLARADEVIE